MSGRLASAVVWHASRLSGSLHSLPFLQPPYEPLQASQQSGRVAHVLHLIAISHSSRALCRQVCCLTAAACTACQPTAIWPSPLSLPAGKLPAGPTSPRSLAPARMHHVRAAAGQRLLQGPRRCLYRKLSSSDPHQTLQVLITQALSCSQGGCTG